MLNLGKYFYTCNVSNELPNMAMFLHRECTGSPVLCEFGIDPNNTFLEDNLKQLTWPYEIHPSHGWITNSTEHKRISTMLRNMIILRVRFSDYEVDMTVQDSRTTLSDKIANLGGTYGIWAELTGCSLLGIINIFLIMMKIPFQPRN